MNKGLARSFEKQTLTTKTLLSLISHLFTKNKFLEIIPKTRVISKQVLKQIISLRTQEPIFHHRQILPLPQIRDSFVKSVL